MFGKALESLVHHELCAYREYRDRQWDLSYWRLASGIEVDFVVGNADVAIEVKSTSRVGTHHLTGLEAIREDHARVRRRILVSLETRRRVTKDGIEILPVVQFLNDLWRGDIA